MPTGTPHDWPLTGRESELQAVEAAVNGGGGALISGDPGVGKTRLLGAALARAAAAGRLLVSVGGAGRECAEPVEAFGSLAECLRWLETAPRGRAPGERPLLGIDDAHLVDAASAAHLYRAVAAGRLTVVAAVQRDAPAPVGIDKLWVGHLVQRIEVAHFDRSAVSQLLHARLHGHVDTATLERLWAATHGNALMLRELVEPSLEDGSLRCVNGIWHWHGLSESPARRLADVIHLGLRDLTAEETELVRMLAVVEWLEADIAVQSGLSHAAESLNLRGVVAVERAGLRVRLRLALPLSRVVVASRMSDLTARRLRRHIAEAIERTGARRHDDQLRIVTLRVDADLLPERHQLLAATRTAVRRHDFELAERLCRFALGGAQGEPVTVPAAARSGGSWSEAAPSPHATRAANDERRPADDAPVTLLFGQILAGQGRYPEAETAFTAAMEAASPARPDDYRAAVQARAANVAWGLRRVEDAATMLDEAVATVGHDNAGTLHGSRAVVAVMADRLDEAVAIGDTVLPGHRPDSPATQALAPVVAFARTELGDPAGALDLLARCRGAVEGWDEDFRLLYEVVTARCSFLMGNLRAVAAALEAMRQYSATDDRPRQLQITVLRARLHRIFGQPQEAVSLLRQASAGQGRHDWLVTRAWTLAQLAGALAESGQQAAALRTLVEARSVQSRSVAYPLAADGMAMERALILAHSGDRSGAVAQAMELARRAADAGRPAMAVGALHLAARVSDAGTLAAQAGSLAAGSTSELVRLQAGHIRALAEGDGDTLAEVAARFRDMGAQPLAAEAAAQAARAYQASGQHRRSRVARAGCQEILAGYGGSLPPWLVAGTRRDTAVAPLTTREREVAALAAGGLSNREIATRLVVSVRTVENHLHRVYHKLGITARSDLARGLGRATGEHQSGDPSPVREVHLAQPGHATAGQSAAEGHCARCSRLAHQPAS